MSALQYRIELESGEVYTGAAELSGELRLALPLHGTLKSVTAAMPLSIAPEEKIFMNGFQTWTYCPEYTAKDRIPSLRRLPKLGVKHYGLDRYGDEYFLPYPDKPGLTHGESWCYFRLGTRYRLLGSLDERPGYTLFFYDANKGELTIRRDCEGLRVDGEYRAFDLFFAEGGEDEVFDAWFAAMGVKCRTHRSIRSI